MRKSTYLYRPHRSGYYIHDHGIVDVYCKRGYQARYYIISIYIVRNMFVLLRLLSWLFGVGHLSPQLPLNLPRLLHLHHSQLYILFFVVYSHPNTSFAEFLFLFLYISFTNIIQPLPFLFLTHTLGISIYSLILCILYRSHSFILSFIYLPTHFYFLFSSYSIWPFSSLQYSFSLFYLFIYCPKSQPKHNLRPRYTPL